LTIAIPSLCKFANPEHLQANLITDMSRTYDTLKDHPGKFSKLFIAFQAGADVELFASLFGVEWQMLTCYCLISLTHLELQVTPTVPYTMLEYVQSRLIVLDKVTKCLPALEDLILWVGLDLDGTTVTTRLSFLKLFRNCPSGCVEGKGSDGEDFNQGVGRVFRDPANPPAVSV
jgi:hypothetical protein